MKHDFKYVKKDDPQFRTVYADAVSLIREVQDAVRDRFTFQYRAVGSYSRNMVTYDAKSNTGYDLDFDLIVNDDDERYTAKKIKEFLRAVMNQAAKKYGYDFPEDSTRVLTMKCKDRKNSKILHSIDFAITNEYTDEAGVDRRAYIHFAKKTNQYIWCEQPSGAYKLPERIAMLKSEQLWSELREHYRKKKNENDNPKLHSRQLFSMAVNDLILKYGLESEGEQEDPVYAGQNGVQAICLGICSLPYGEH